MPLHATPGLAAEVPGFSQAQLDSLARSVEARRVRLEEDIAAYIARKQEELQQYEAELVETLRAMDRDEDPDAASEGSTAASRRSSTDSRGERIDDADAARADNTTATAPDEHKKKKHGRVHKREKELYGLVTPVFLPLLDARESTSPEKKVPRKDADGAAKHPRDKDDDQGDMPGDTPTRERAAADPVKKRRSSIKKKSALRHSSAPRNRKRVSLVIDDQVVLPSDLIAEPALTSPGSETTSATASTASLDDVIDPRLTADGPVFIEHSDAVHHSLPLSMAHPAKPSPVAAPACAPPSAGPAPAVAEAHHSPPTSPSVRSPPLPYAPPSYATRSFLDPPPAALPVEPAPGPIYLTMDDAPDESASQAVAADAGFQTYVGGLSGSGVDDVNQVGSVGYPSSLGASYLESYMQGRPLSVRMAAAEREGDEGELRRLRGLEERRKMREREEKSVHEDEWGVPAKGRDADDDGFMGSMDDF